MSCNRHTLRPFPALVAMCLLASCASEGQTLGKGFLVSDTDTLQVHPVPGRVHSAHLHSLSLDTIKWEERCARIDPSDIPQVQDMPHAAFWNDHFWNWAVNRMEDHLSDYECEPTYEEWLEEAKRTQCNGREWVGTYTCEEQIAWCESVSLEEGRSWYRYIANPQYTADFNTHFTATHDSAGILSLEHRDWMGQYRHWCRVQATTIHTSTGLEVPTEWAYAGIDRSTWWHAIRKQFQWEYHLPDSSKADLEMHRGIYAPSEVVDYDFFLSEDSVYSLVSLYATGGSFEHAIPIRAWEPDALHAYMEQSRVGTATIFTIKRDPWNNASRCFHMDIDQVPELRPHGRFAMANRDIRQFRRSMIGSKDHCCRNNPAEGINCEEEGYYHETTRITFDEQQMNEDVVSVLMYATKNWGGSMASWFLHPISVSAKTGLKLPLPDALSDVSMVDLSTAMKQEFIDGEACDGGLQEWSQDLDQLRGWYFADLKKGQPFLVKNGEWHWVKVGHPRHCNAGHQLWTIPTGVAFEP
jgi:hypothetical protein